MTLTYDRFVFEPGLALIGGMTLFPQGVEEAIEISGIVEEAETAGTPLNELLAKLYSTEPGDHSGHGDHIAEFSGRQCYRSWGKGRPQGEYIANVIEQQHGSVFRHAGLIFQIVGVSRALTHELIRHGVGTAPSQESQRYVDAKEMRFVVPPITAYYLRGKSQAEIEADPEFMLFRASCERALTDYTEYQTRLKVRLKALHDAGDYKGATSYQKRANEAARSLLPNAAETRLDFTMNLQSMRHILSLRGTEFADLEIRRLAIGILERSRSYAPHFFKEVTEALGEDGLPIINALNGKL